MHDVRELDEVAATIPDRYLRNLATHGDAVVIAKRFCPEDATRTEVDNLAEAIERRAKAQGHTTEA
jgi:hypothetical protein